MTKGLQILHKVIGMITWCALIISLVYLLLVWNTIPDEIGVHFGPEGEFDWYDSKWYAFYPYVVGFLMLLICELAGLVAKRMKSGLKITEVGENALRRAFYIWIDTIKVEISIFWTYWADCVIKQHAQDTNFVITLVWGLLCSLFLIVVVVVGVRIKYRVSKGENTDED